MAVCTLHGTAARGSHGSDEGWVQRNVTQSLQIILKCVQQLLVLCLLSLELHLVARSKSQGGPREFVSSLL